MKVLVTGGAGFIGSHIASRYAASGHEVVVFDNLTSGRTSNVPKEARLIVGDLANKEELEVAASGTDLIFHQAAARAVLKSVEDPLGTDRSNTLGTLNVLVAARDANVRRVVIASSSSIYGGLAPLPTHETALPCPKSPYAVSKLAAENYARVFTELYGLETVALRYFNVFGPRQRPDDQYSAVIPIFIAALRHGEPIQIHGDGCQTRDFTFVDDVVAANELAATAPASVVAGNAYNVGRGETHNLLELAEILGQILGVRTTIDHGPERMGDVRASQADITAAVRDLGYRPEVSFEEGLRLSVAALCEQ